MTEQTLIRLHYRACGNPITFAVRYPAQTIILLGYLWPTSAPLAYTPTVLRVRET